MTPSITSSARYDGQGAGVHGKHRQIQGWHTGDPGLLGARPQRVQGSPRRGGPQQWIDCCAGSLIPPRQSGCFARAQLGTGSKLPSCRSPTLNLPLFQPAPRPAGCGVRPVFLSSLGWVPAQHAELSSRTAAGRNFGASADFQSLWRSHIPNHLRRGAEEAGRVVALLHRRAPADQIQQGREWRVRDFEPGDGHGAPVLSMKRSPETRMRSLRRTSGPMICSPMPRWALRHSSNGAAAADLARPQVEPPTSVSSIVNAIRTSPSGQTPRS